MASIRKTDSSTWQVRYRDPNGRQHARNFDRKIDASRFANTVETDKARGDWLDPRLAKVTFEELGRYTDATTGKPVDNVTRYTYADGDGDGDGEERYVITFTRHSDLTSNKFIDDLKGPKKAAARLVGFDGAYLRFAGELRIDHYDGAQLVTSHTDEALWELMYFGKARP